MPAEEVAGLIVKVPPVPAAMLTAFRPVGAARNCSASTVNAPSSVVLIAGPAAFAALKMTVGVGAGGWVELSAPAASLAQFVSGPAFTVLHELVPCEPVQK